MNYLLADFGFATVVDHSLFTSQAFESIHLHHSPLTIHD
jgi:hypothetical protein